MRAKFSAGVLGALAFLIIGMDFASAQTPRTHRIERVANQRLIGSSYARMPGLTYAQCEARCLADQRCNALEHIRAGDISRPTCRLFASTSGARESAQADIGWKRPIPGVAPAQPTPVAEGSGKKKSAKKSAAKEDSPTRPAAAPMPPPAPVTDERQRAAEEMRRAAEETARMRQAELERASRERAEQERQRAAATEKERAPPGTEMRRFEMRREPAPPPPPGAQPLPSPSPSPPAMDSPRPDIFSERSGGGGAQPSQPSYRNGGGGSTARSAPPPTPPMPPPVAMAPAPGASPPAPSTAPRAAEEKAMPPAAANGGGPSRTRSAAPSPSTTTTTPAAPTARPPAAPEAAPPPVGADAGTSDWDIVPVFYGTDRARKDREQPKRIAYSADRARRLELGRALITVPKAHQVPNVERPWAIKVPFTDIVVYQETEDPKRHFTIKELQNLSKTDALALIRERLAKSASYKDHALIFVHGYSNSFDDALYRTAQVAYDLKFDGAPFLYSWPSGGGMFGYAYDTNSAKQAERFMGEFLQFVLDDTGAKSVSIIAHSMGNQLLLEVLRDLKRRNPNAPRIDQVILAAPDVDRDTFETMASDIRGIGRGITMYASSNDKALVASRRYAGAPRAGDVPDGLGPFITAGIDTIDVSALSTEYLALNHSTYAERTALLRDIELILRTGMRPPELRLPSILLPVSADTGVFWRYKN